MLNLNFRVMKISKYLLVAAASVMLFSCAKDDNNGQKFNGPVALSLNLVAQNGVNSKAFTDATEGDNGGAIELEYTSFDVKLNAAQGGSTDWETVQVADISD